MSDRTCLIIDDVHAALDKLTGLGRQVATEGALGIREVVLDFAQRHGWSVVPYSLFVSWSTRMLEQNEHQWVVIDPLFPTQTVGRRAHALRATRVGSGLSVQIDEPPSALAPHQPVVVLDDAAATGRTLQQVSRLLRTHAVTVHRFVLCASTRLARDRLRRETPDAAWVDYFPGDWRILHLRDGCPYLPFTGRRLDTRDDAIGDGNSSETSVPATAMAGSVWQTLTVIPSIRDALAAASKAAEGRLSELLGRQALVGDLSLLGANVAAPGDAKDLAFRTPVI